ncbi:MAG TPA: septum formation initiator family protein [Solirubrobacteraceae bacterium]
MPPARPATATPRRNPRPAPRKRPRVVARPPLLRVRWERVGRIGLLVVLAVVVGLYVEHTLSYFATRSQAQQQRTVVTRLTRQNAALTKEQKALNSPSMIIAQARALGMVRPNERPYVITGKAAP